jgi:hypothetical protein
MTAPLVIFPTSLDSVKLLEGPHYSMAENDAACHWRESLVQPGP